MPDRTRCRAPKRTTLSAALRRGKYDEAFIDYTIEILRRCKAYGFRICTPGVSSSLAELTWRTTLVISAHQDVFSRFQSGSGAPYWVLVALGLHPRRLHQTGAALVHGRWATEGNGGEEGRRAAAAGEVEEFPDSRFT